MENSDRIEQIRKQQEQRAKDNCPTAVLFYIATGMRSPRPVNPWYDTIKELSGGANFHFRYFHRAVIFGMYPELRDACNYFDVSMKQAIQKKEKLSDDDVAKIENDTINKYDLAGSYFIAQSTEEQQKRINVNLISAMNRYVNTEIKQYAPAVQVLAQALKTTLPENENIGHDFVNYFEFVDICIRDENRFLKNKSIPSKDVTETAEKLFDLQHQGVLDKDFKITDYVAFKESSLVKTLSYKGKEYNVSQSLMPQSNLVNIKREFVF